MKNADTAQKPRSSRRAFFMHGLADLLSGIDNWRVSHVFILTSVHQAGPLDRFHETSQLGMPRFTAPPKNFAAPARKIPAPAGQIRCPATAGNLLQVTGNSASIQSGTADAAANPKELPAKFATHREREGHRSSPAHAEAASNAHKRPVTPHSVAKYVHQMFRCLAPLIDDRLFA
jgi:hypothetical protein